MNQRLLAGLLAVPLVIALGVYALGARLPYAYYTPGGTVNVLGRNEQGARILQVVGHPVYPDDGDLRMTYISVSRPSQTDAADDHSGWLRGFVALAAWFDGDQAVVPYEDAHPAGETADSSRQQGAVQMKTSQQDAVAVALRALGEKVGDQVQVASVTQGAPADGKLQVGDAIRTFDGRPLQGADSTAQATWLTQQVRATPPGDTIRLGIERQAKNRTITLTPAPDTSLPASQQVPRIGIQSGIGYRFPFTVSINIDPDIGGPSAGLMFSLAVYDYLTPGSLTAGHDVGGTGEIEADGTVGPIGGIQQKIATARGDGVQLYFVPTENCADALNVSAGSMRLVRATSFSEALKALQTWTADPNATLPSCTDAAVEASAAGSGTR